ncbi:AMP-binding protein [Rhodopila globiformis]|uniref:3-methylmercaptopropionyl-CoA ligase n=1 Tax=Rhodopila globiformis TaxID=1071 RepID=A0A2S6NFL6_RHOGL|nr:AMP-binding protein [Rhodopila globiformis]PPQ33418.1 acyl-CoA synthetase [Rhodopila globiformis]
MSIYDEKPWLNSYAPGQPAGIVPEHADALSMFRSAVARSPDADAIRYFGTRISYRALDALSDALAAALVDRGFGRGDRVALYLQNVPQFVIGLIATWKAGGVAVSVNPMNRHRELELLLTDSGACVLLCLETLYRDVAAAVVPRTSVRMVITTSELDDRSRDDGRLFANVERVASDGAIPLSDLLAGFRGRAPPEVAFSASDSAFLTYTSGTTGPPKGAMNSHGNFVYNCQVYRDWCGLGAADVVLGLAPLFHITGLVGHIGVALLLGAPLVLTYRFEPAVVLETIRDEHATFAVGAITAFIAMMNHPDARTENLATLRKVFSGGAPIPPAVIKTFREQFGHYIHSVYGLTETTSPSHIVPVGAEAPVDEASGALSVGVPVYGTTVRIVGEDGQDLPAGEAGEIVTTGPQVIAGYWNKPEETAHAIRDGRFHTGDVGYMDQRGWFYIVDRKKDQINAAGYKVWPREVEDVLYEHDAVLEAAVVGAPDPYRGETVKAFISLRPGRSVTPDALILFCKQRLAAYKYPRIVEVLDELPKTVTGKILRRELRAKQSP